MGIMKETKAQKIIWNIYKELYENSEPKVDFDELLNSAERNNEGQKIIPFENYFIEQELMDEIIEKHLKNKRLTKLAKNSIRVNVYLGVSPVSKK
jgi:hypothetical protein